MTLFISGVLGRSFMMGMIQADKAEQEIPAREARVSNVYRMTAAALLVAIGIVIPMVMPIKVIIEPMSFTLASHVAIFLAVLMAPDIAALVVVGTTLGFLVAGFPIVIVLRAASHIVFALVAAFYLKKYPEVLFSPVKFHVFSFVVGVIHAICEVIVVCFYYMFIGGLGEFMATGGMRVLLLLVGVGTVVHSMVDFEIAYLIFRALRRQKSVRRLFVGSDIKRKAA
jgi:niacin transporter